jgi:hypothetical protein
MKQTEQLAGIIHIKMIVHRTHVASCFKIDIDIKIKVHVDV